MFSSRPSFTAKKNTGYSFGGSSHTAETPSTLDSKSSKGGATPPLVELRHALNRIEAIVKRAKLDWESSQTSKTTNKSGRSTLRQRGIAANRKRRDKRSKSTAISPTPEDDSPTSGGRSRTRQRGEENACFIHIDHSDEEELIELLRRTAELVVTGERSAAIALSGDGDGGGGMDEADRHLAIFEHFCERNALPLIVNIVTGAAFSPSRATSSSSATPSTAGAIGSSDSDSDPDSMDLTLLPPVTVATQSIQSVSILIQNVSRATSLYFLLSNNRINDLINFPLGLYAAAERSAKGNISEIGRGGHVAKKDDYSPEMGELSARFVSFLKSLAMRMNAETLQFFLKYPPQQRRRMSGDATQNEETSGTLGEDCPDDEINNNSTTENKLSGKNALIDFPLSPTDDGSADLSSQVGHEEEKDTDEKLSSQQKLSDPVSLGLTDVEFPLYARALEFCSSEQDTFVRVTAMNICLNTLRLSSYDGKNDNEEEGDSDGAPASPSSSSAPMSLNPAMMNTPDGTLHNMDALPLRERVAIARHVCDPNRVEGLISPIFAKLAGLCGTLEETIRSMDKANEIMTNENMDSGEESGMSVSSGSVLASDDEQKRRRIKQKKKRRRRKDKMDRLMNDFKDLSADLQDELMLLEDVLKVGLTSLNEQTIEMMMATFIYPLLLQPLLYLQRCNPQNRPFLDIGCDPPASVSSRSSLDSSDPTNRSEVVSRKSTNSPHPFSAETLSTALARSGLLNEECNPIILRLPSMENDQSPSTGESMPDTDMAPAKTAFFGLAAVFHTVTHQPLLRLLLTALFHPLAPAASGGEKMIRSEPNVVCSDINGNLIVRVDGASASLDNSRVGLGKIYGTGIYSFGRSAHEQSSGSDARNLDGGTNSESSDIKNIGMRQPLCNFVLSPALADILNASAGSVSSVSSRWRENPYRRIVLACLAGTDGMLSLRPTSVLAMDAAMSALDVRSMDTILFGKNMHVSSDNKTQVETDNCDAEATVMPPDESQAILSQSPINGSLNDSKSSMKSRYITEVMAALCFSVITAPYSVKGVWRLDFDQTSADALVRVSKICPSAATIAAKLLDHRRLQSATFVSQLPSLLYPDSISSGTNGTKGETPEDEEQLDVIMDRIFFDLLNESNRCVVEKLFLDRVQGESSDDWYGQFRVPISTRISLNNFCSVLCKDPLDDDDDVLLSEKERSLRFASVSTFSHLQLDALTTFIKDLSSKPIELLGRDNPKGNSDRADDDTILTYLSKPICTSILEKPNGDKVPIPGSSVELVGRAAFPCVCEVSESSASLFSAHGATVSEGVTWQSLYLVILGKYMILSEPESGSSEGNGRIVMSCRLSCLTVEKDKPINANNGSTACRLILSHASHDPQPPGVFNITKIKTNDDNLGTRFTHGRMDVWFEDGKAAAHAFKVLAFKILKAKSIRGSKLREALTFDDQLQSSSLFNRA